MHIDDDDLEFYALRRPEWLKTATIEEHLLVCQLCRDRLDRIDEYLAIIRIALQMARYH